MLGRAALLLAILVVLAWLGASAFVAWVPPGGLADTTLELGRTEEGRPRWQLAHPPPHPGSDEGASAWAGASPAPTRGASTSDPGTSDERGTEYLLVRGALDAARGTFPLSVGLLLWGWEPVRILRLEVTRDVGWADEETAADADWIVLEARAPRTDGRWQSAALAGEAPAGTVAWRYVLTESDGGEWSTGQTIPRPRSRADRLLEDLAAWPILRWLADKRER